MVFNIILVDQLRLPDKHSEGTITEAQFRRLISQLRCFELSESDMVRYLTVEVCTNMYGREDWHLWRPSSY